MECGLDAEPEKISTYVQCVQCNLYCMYVLFMVSGAYESISIGGGGRQILRELACKKLTPPPGNIVLPLKLQVLINYLCNILDM